MYICHPKFFLSSLGECGNPDTVVSASSAERIYLIVSRFASKPVVAKIIF